MKNEKTFVIIKPDGIQRSLIGEVIKRFERIGLKLVGLKMQVPTVEMVRASLNGLLEGAGRDDLIGFAQNLPPEVGGPYNPRTGTSAATIIKNIIDRMKAREPSFR